MTETNELPIVKFHVQDAAIAEMSADYMPLTINGLDDTEGFKAVHAARMVVRTTRVDVEKKRKELKADALKFGRTVDSEAKRITALLAPIEEHLQSEEDRFLKEKERIKTEAARIEQDRLDAIKAEEEARLQAERDAEAAKIKAEQDAENERLRVEREKLEAERLAMDAARKEMAEKARIAEEKLDAERQAYEAEQKRLADIEQQKLDTQRKAMEAEQEKIRAEKQRIADIEAERVRKEDMEKAKAEAAEEAKREAEERIAREAEEAKAKAEAERQLMEAARLREEALRPDKEKLLAVARAIAAIVVPDVSADAVGTASEIKHIIRSAAVRAEELVSRLS